MKELFLRFLAVAWGPAAVTLLLLWAERRERHGRAAP